MRFLGSWYFSPGVLRYSPAAIRSVVYLSKRPRLPDHCSGRCNLWPSSSVQYSRERRERRGHLEDLQLIRRAVSGERYAEAELFRAHFRRVYRVIFRMTGDAALTDDLTQDAFIRAFERLSTFRGDSSFSTWLTRIAVRVTLNELARVRTREQRTVPLDQNLSDSRLVIGDSLLKDRIEAALSSLPELSRGVLAMYLEGYSHEEIAGAFSISIGASKTRLSRAREALRASLSDLVAS